MKAFKLKLHCRGQINRVSYHKNRMDAVKRGTAFRKEMRALSKAYPESNIGHIYSSDTMVVIEEIKIE